MNQTVFDGREFAKAKEEKLTVEVLDLKNRGISPKLGVILVGADPASELYVRLKSKVAERVGITVELYRVSEADTEKTLFDLIDKLNQDSTVNGILLQLPLPEPFKKDTTKIIDEILPEKDVDGLRDGSPYLHATSQAIVDILNLAELTRSEKVAVVGASGMVGRPLMNALRKMQYAVRGYDSKNLDLGEVAKADVVISCTGKPGLIKKIKKGAVVVDVGSPVGDVAPEALKNARFYTPVPGGVGPVTIVSLLENLVKAAYNK